MDPMFWDDVLWKGGGFVVVVVVVSAGAGVVGSDAATGKGSYVVVGWVSGDGVAKGGAGVD